MHKITTSATPILLTLITFLFIASSCFFNRNYGPVERESREIDDFTELEVSHGIEVYFSMSDRLSLEVETHEGLMDKLKTRVRGDKLTIYFEGNFHWNSMAKVYLDCKNIEKISASGGSKVVGEDLLESYDLDLRSSGGSDIKLEVDSRDLSAHASGGADIVLSGYSKYFEANSSGGSDIKALEMVVENANLEASGGADITIDVKESLEARASGGADIKYRGNPSKVDIHDSSGGDIRNLN